MKRGQTALLFLFIALPFFAQQHVVIPRPVDFTWLQSVPCYLSDPVKIVAEKGFLSEAVLLAGELESRFNCWVVLVEEYNEKEGGTLIRIGQDTDRSHPTEGYQLKVDSKGCLITASDPVGAFYGCNTLLQLIEADPEKDGQYCIKSVDIKDYPRFGWRGLMMDCSRTFLSMDYLKKTIDRMAFYKLNKLHLHLTDDQGWRLEIKSRPKLTSEGAAFAASSLEPENFSGYYTQQQMKELIAYAAQRHVEVIPEIEAPGHSSAALYAYPELSCSKLKVPVYPLFAFEGERLNDVYCAGTEDTYVFFKDVLGEVARIFPSPYIHLGGDEVRTQLWKECKVCRNKMNELGIDSEVLLQRYMMTRAAENVLSAGKMPICWDEAIEGDIGKDWIIMAWQEQEKGRIALQKGYQVVMTPTSHLYFDYSYATTPTRKVYSYDPVPPDATEDEKSRILGIQANYWTHIDRWESRIDYQLFPRVLALYEKAWSEETVVDYDDFRKRGKQHKLWFHYFGIEYNGNDM
ncbi:hexosaminidase [Porphyromonadaceae bacterium KH3R12]|nr:hexosaminidase [Porphyromonadaceae bacterium KH3R12]